MLPWYGLESNFFALDWLFDGYPLDSEVAPALFLVLQGKKLWLAPLGACVLLAPLALWRREKQEPLFGNFLIAVGAIGLVWFFAQGFGIGLRGWRYEWLNAAFGPLADRQFGMGYGAHAGRRRLAVPANARALPHAAPSAAMSSSSAPSAWSSRSSACSSSCRSCRCLPTR